MRSPQPRRSNTSSVRLAKQIAREPLDSLLSSSSSTTGMCRSARSMASVRPTGPAPTITTGWRAGVGGGILVGVALVVEAQALVVDHVLVSATPALPQEGEGAIPDQPSSAFHMSMSRCAVHTRGSAWPEASSYARLTSKGMQWSKITHWLYLGLSFS
jgi:hypothetical protein